MRFKLEPPKKHERFREGPITSRIPEGSAPYPLTRLPGRNVPGPRAIHQVFHRLHLSPDRLRTITIYWQGQLNMLRAIEACRQRIIAKILPSNGSKTKCPSLESLAASGQVKLQLPAILPHMPRDIDTFCRAARTCRVMPGTYLNPHFDMRENPEEKGLLLIPRRTTVELLMPMGENDTPPKIERTIQNAIACAINLLRACSTAAGTERLPEGEGRETES